MATAFGAESVWSPIPLDFRREVNEGNLIRPTHFEAFALDRNTFQNLLINAPREFTSEARTPLQISLPNPDGTFSRFQVVEAPIMEPALAEKFPEIKTYRGQGIDDPAATLRFSLTPLGFQAQVLSPNGTFYIDPAQHSGEDNTYISYFRRDLPGQRELPFVENGFVGAARIDLAGPAIGDQQWAVKEPICLFSARRIRFTTTILVRVLAMGIMPWLRTLMPPAIGSNSKAV